MLLAFYMLVALSQLSSLNHLFFSDGKCSFLLSTSHTFLLWSIMVAVLAATGQDLHSVPISWSAKGRMMCYFLPSGALHTASLTFSSLANPRGKWLKTEPAPTEVDGEMPTDFSGSWIRLQERNWMLLIIGSRPRCWCPCGLFFNISSAAWSFHLFVGCWKDSEKFKLDWLSLVHKRCEQLFCVYVYIYACIYIKVICAYIQKHRPCLLPLFFIFLSPKLRRIHCMVLKSLKEMRLVKYLHSSGCSYIGKSS